MRDRRCVPPPAGNRPNCTSGRPTTSPGMSATNRWWQASAISRPPPIAVPLMAQATGLPQVSSLRSRLDSENTFSNISAGGSLAIASAFFSMSLRSAPARNSGLAEVTTAPFSAGSDLSRSMHASRSSRNTWSMVLVDFAGWSIVQTTMSPSMSWRITVVMVVSLRSAR